jgi:hypothetical protein
MRPLSGVGEGGIRRGVAGWFGARFRGLVGGGLARGNRGLKIVSRAGDEVGRRMDFYGVVGVEVGACKRERDKRKRFSGGRFLPRVGVSTHQPWAVLDKPVGAEERGARSGVGRACGCPFGWQGWRMGAGRMPPRKRSRCVYYGVVGVEVGACKSKRKRFSVGAFTQGRREYTPTLGCRE